MDPSRTLEVGRLTFSIVRALFPPELHVLVTLARFTNYVLYHLSASKGLQDWMFQASRMRETSHGTIMIAVLRRFPYCMGNTT